MKLERKVVEKNRRNHMKTLYSHLFSLLPASHHSNQGMSSSSWSPGSAAAADQIDEAIRYIKSLESNLKKLGERKESLAQTRKRSHSSCSSSDRKFCGRCCSSSKGKKSSSPSPELQIREVGSVMEVVLRSGSGRDESMVLFQDVIRILEDEQLEVLNANFAAINGDSTFLSTVLAKIKESCIGLGAAKLSERLQRLVDRSANDPELEAELRGLGDSS